MNFAPFPSKAGGFRRKCIAKALVQSLWCLHLVAACRLAAPTRICHRLNISHALAGEAVCLESSRSENWAQVSRVQCFTHWATGTTQPLPCSHWYFEIRYGMATTTKKKAEQLQKHVLLAVFGKQRWFFPLFPSAIWLIACPSPAQFWSELILPLQQLMTMNLNKGWLNIIKACWLISYTLVLVFLINGLIKKNSSRGLLSRFFSPWCFISETSYWYTS